MVLVGAVDGAGAHEPPPASPSPGDGTVDLVLPQSQRRGNVRTAVTEVRFLSARGRAAIQPSPLFCLWNVRQGQASGIAGESVAEGEQFAVERRIIPPSPHTWRIISSKGERVRSSGSTNRHHSALMARPPPPAFCRPAPLFWLTSGLCSVLHPQVMCRKEVFSGSTLSPPHPRGGSHRPSLGGSSWHTTRAHVLPSHNTNPPHPRVTEAYPLNSVEINANLRRGAIPQGLPQSSGTNDLGHDSAFVGGGVLRPQDDGRHLRCKRFGLLVVTEGGGRGTPRQWPSTRSVG